MEECDIQNMVIKKSTLAKLKSQVVFEDNSYFSSCLIFIINFNIFVSMPFNGPFKTRRKDTWRIKLEIAH